MNLKEMNHKALMSDPTSPAHAPARHQLVTGPSLARHRPVADRTNGSDP